MASIRELAKARGISPATAVRYRRAGIDLEDQASVDRYKEECAARQFVSKTMPKMPQGAFSLFTNSGPTETELTQTLGLSGAIQRLREIELSLANQAAQGDKSAFSRWALAIETLRKAEASLPEIDRMNADSLSAAEVEMKWSTALLAFRHALRAMPQRAAILLEGLDVVTIERKLSEEIEQIIELLASDQFLEEAGPPDFEEE